MKTVLAAGLMLLALGSVWAGSLGEEGGTPARLAGLLCGMGGSLTAIGLGSVLMNRFLGAKRARQRELHMEDERGLMVAYKAQNVAAIAAVLAIVAMLVAALVRGDTFYMQMGTAACCMVAAVKIVAWYVYDRKM